MSLLSARIFALNDSLVVLGPSMPRTLYWHCLIALCGMSTFGTILPLVPILLMILYPRKSKPSVIWVTFVFSSDTQISPEILRYLTLRNNYNMAYYKALCHFDWRYATMSQLLGLSKMKSNTKWVPLALLGYRLQKRDF